ncbi:hypothetical protein GGR54DRAFT_650094 [Hypoxylon sp. NC1633]|nr:hypothetical protein GGR54DRAFT_650094 [Hypoxylon sp. NC1633]
MDQEGQYQSSQAFSHIVPSENESVNPNTASLNYKAPLLQLRGIRPSIDLNLNMIYSFGTTGTFGLPPNWSLDLPYVLDGKSVTANGRTYVIDFEWSDVTHYASGLKYVNNHGIKFKKIVPPQDLPSGLPGQYGYQLDHVDGSKDFFDVYGKPLEHHDIYDNFIYYSYLRGAESGVGDQQVLLGFIQDSWGQKIQFGYQEGSEFRFTLPDGSFTRLMFSQEGILTINDPAGLRTVFEYVPFVGNQNWKVLTSITYPTGLISRYEYGVVEYLDADMSAQNMPMVIDHYHLDADYQQYSHTAYDLGGLSGGNTYTGKAIGLQMAGSTDTLMDGDGKALSYSYDQDKHGLARTTTWFNNYHLPVEQIRYTTTGQGSFKEAYKTVYSYDIPIDEGSRTTAYNLPASTEGFHNTASEANPEWQPLVLSRAKYNEYGNLVSSTEEVQVPGSGYVKQSTTQNDYTTTAVNIQVVTKSVQTDEITQAEEQTENVPTADGRAISSSKTSFRAGSGQPVQPWIQRSSEYDSRGRNSSETIAWAPGATVPDGSVSSVTNKITYAFSNGTLTQTAYDADNNATTVTYDMRRYSGPVTSKTLPRGQMETFEYDSISRLLKHTDALGHVTTTTYTVGPKGGSQSEESPMGFIKLTYYDILGRETDTLDNGDPTESSTEPSRLVSRQSYDFRSQVKESTDILGLTTKYAYDGLDRQVSITDPKGNVVRNVYDDASMAVTQTMNGDLRTITWLNGRSDKVKVASHPDSDDSSTDYYLVEDTVYDGNRRVVSTISSQTPKSQGEPTVLERTDTEYGPKSVVLSRTITGYTSAGQDVVKRQFTLDLFGNVYTWLKETTYADGRSFQHTGPVDIYDKNNRLAVTRNQLGQEETSTYDDNGWLQATKRIDGSSVTYTCDDVGQFIATAYPSGTTEYVYDADGRLSKVKDDTGTIEYKTSLDGTLMTVTYPDGRIQTNTLDSFNRAVEETDVFGVSRTTEFGATGEISCRKCKTDTVTYHYGVANHMQGQCIGFTLSGGRTCETEISYDGFNRLRRTTAQDSDSEMLLDTTYSIDARGKIQSLQTRSTTCLDLNVKRSLVYDGLGQIVEDSNDSGSPRVTTYAYDGNSNILSKVTDGVETKMSYNEIDQRTDDGFKYDTIGRMTQDNQGYQYDFDDRDRLISVQAAAGNSSGFQYRADNYLSRRDGAKDSAEMYYNSGKVNAMEITSDTGDSTNASLFSEERAFVASYTDSKAPDYFLDSLGSTAILSGESEDVSITYDTYGVPKTSSTIETRSSFGFGQMFTDQTSGLVYMRSRYYSPKHMAFISMDHNRQENRYAYCEGDPINHFDPLGESWISAVALGVGLLVGGLATAGVGFFVEAGLVAVGISEVAAATASAIVGGAAGNVIGGFASAQVSGAEYGVEDAVIDAIVGAVGGYAGELVKPSAMRYAAGFEFRGKNLSSMGQMALSSGITGAVNSGTQAIARPLLRGEPINPLMVLTSMAGGFASGVVIKTYAKETAKAQYKAVSPRAMSATRQFLSRIRSRMQATKPSEIKMLTAESVDLVAFASGRSSSINAGMSDQASSMATSRVGTLSRYGAADTDRVDIPLLIKEL